MKYKVIKDFGIAEKGDIFVNSEEMPNYFSMEVSENDTYKNMGMTEDLIEAYAKQGYLIKIEEVRSLDKIDEVVAYINELMEAYANDHAEVEEKYVNQEIPTCVKVEAETVYYNLTKVLTEIKNRLTA